MTVNTPRHLQILRTTQSPGVQAKKEQMASGYDKSVGRCSGSVVVLPRYAIVPTLATRQKERSWRIPVPQLWGKIPSADCSKIPMVYDFADNGMQMECVAYVIEKACNSCNAVSQAQRTIMEHRCRRHAVAYWNYAKRSTDETVAYYFDVLYAFGISPNTIWNHERRFGICRGPVQRHLDTISQAPYIQPDESCSKSTVRKYRLVWSKRCHIHCRCLPSRSARVLDLLLSAALQTFLLLTGVCRIQQVVLVAKSRRFICCARQSRRLR